MGLGWGLCIRKAGGRQLLLYSTQEGPIVKEGEVNREVFLVDDKLLLVSEGHGEGEQSAFTSSSHTWAVCRGD